jgi:hypothetical protein
METVWRTVKKVASTRNTCCNRVKVIAGKVLRAKEKKNINFRVKPLMRQ